MGVFDPLRDLWDDVVAPADPVDQLVYRSRLLGADLRVTNYAGGNTSSKTAGTDPVTGSAVHLLWVKGSGGDLGTLSRSGLACLDVDRVRGLERTFHGVAFEDEQVALLPSCVVLPGAPPSIDTPLHAWVDAEHVYDLGLKLRDLQVAAPGVRGVVLGGHGLVTWADSARDCYRLTIQVINRAAEHIASRAPSAPFGSPRRAALDQSVRHRQAARMMPVLRGALGAAGAAPGLAHFRDDPAVLEFVGSEAAPRLVAQGTSCPDHFLRTKRSALRPRRRCATHRPRSYSGRASACSRSAAPPPRPGSWGSSTSTPST